METIRLGGSVCYPKGLLLTAGAAVMEVGMNMELLFLHQAKDTDSESTINKKSRVYKNLKQIK